MEEKRLQSPVIFATRMVERGGGSIIFTSAFVGSTVGFPGMAAYTASKAGLTGLMQVIAVEYAAHGIRANALLPGGARLYRKPVCPQTKCPAMENRPLRPVPRFRCIEFQYRLMPDGGRRGVGQPYLKGRG